MTDEPLLDEIRRVRHQISASIGHDPRRIVAYYAELQRQHQGRVIDLSGEADQGHCEARFNVIGQGRQRGRQGLVGMRSTFGRNRE